MARDKYSYRRANSNVKPIIITSSLVGAAALGTVGIFAYNAAEENRIAALRYAFNRQYPETFNFAEELDVRFDSDDDGLCNADELAFNTISVVADSDGDGIVDGDEVYRGIEPLSSDSDSDGISDGIEILAGLNPLSDKSDGVTEDAERKFVRDIAFDEGCVTLRGNADIYGATVERLVLNDIASNAGALTFPYEIYSESAFDSAEIKFSYSKELVKTAEINTDSIRIFKFNPLSKEYTAEDSSIDIDKGEVSCTLTNNGVYIVGADRVIQSAAISEDSPLNVYMLIDNSGSMYPKSVQSTSKENDVDFKRLSFAKKFTERLNDNARVAISAFTYDFKRLCDFTYNKDDVFSAIDSIRELGAGFDGTSVERALMLALDSFSKDMQMERNVIILLTDGISTSTAGYDLPQITTLAKAKNVTIMTISLGDEYNRELLQSVADNTGGKYFQISEADVLEGLYATMLVNMKNDIVDENMDGTPDSYTLCDTGFKADENGFSFVNFKSRTNETLDFGMVALARDWFRNCVPESVDCENADISYDFSQSQVDLSQPLHSVFLQSMQASYLNPDSYLDFAKGGTKLCVKKDILEEAQSMGWSVRTVPYSDGTSDWNEAELLYPNHTVARLGNKYSQTDYQLIRAIHYYDFFRDSGKSFTFESESDLIYLKKILSSGVPVITRLTWEENGMGHSRYVLLTALRRNVENPNLFNLKIYDVNDNSMSTIILERTMKVSHADMFTGDYTYAADWCGKKVSVRFFMTDIK